MKFVKIKENSIGKNLQSIYISIIYITYSHMMCMNACTKRYICYMKNERYIIMYKIYIDGYIVVDVICYWNAWLLSCLIHDNRRKSIECELSNIQNGFYLFSLINIHNT
jgi:hypothetical protein